MSLCPVKLGDWLQENAEVRDNQTFNKTTGRRISLRSHAYLRLYWRY